MSSEQNAYLPVLPSVSASASTGSRLTSMTAFNTSSQPSPYTSYQNSPFSGPQQSWSDLQCTEFDQHERKLDPFLLPDNSLALAEQYRLRPQKALYMPWNAPPGYFKLGSEGFAETALVHNSLPP